MTTLHLQPCLSHILTKTYLIGLLAPLSWWICVRGAGWDSLGTITRWCICPRGLFILHFMRVMGLCSSRSMMGGRLGLERCVLSKVWTVWRLLWTLSWQQSWNWLTGRLSRVIPLMSWKIGIVLDSTILRRSIGILGRFVWICGGIPSEISRKKLPLSILLNPSCIIIKYIWEKHIFINSTSLFPGIWKVSFNNMINNTWISLKLKEFFPLLFNLLSRGGQLIYIGSLNPLLGSAVGMKVKIARILTKSDMWEKYLSSFFW